MDNIMPFITLGSVVAIFIGLSGKGNAFFKWAGDSPVVSLFLPIFCVFLFIVLVNKALEFDDKIVAMQKQAIAEAREQALRQAKVDLTNCSQPSNSISENAACSLAKR